MESDVQSFDLPGLDLPRFLNQFRPMAGAEYEFGAEPWEPLRFSELPTVAAFPVDVYPLELQTYCRELAEAQRAPLDFVGLAMLVTAGAAMGQSVSLRVKGGWYEAPLLYGIIVAEPGRTKSPVLRAVVKPLTEIDRRLRDESTLAHERWNQAREAHLKDPEKSPDPGPEPKARRAIVRDVTRESLVLILADNPRGVLCDPDEASGWVASFNEYKGKGGSDRQFWLSVWSSALVSVDRKAGREATHVPFPFVAVLGGLPPDMLTSLGEERGRNDGFLDRILFCYPDRFPAQFWTDQELSPEAARDWSEAINRLFSQPMRLQDGRPVPHLVEFTDQAKEDWIAWFNSHALALEKGDFPTPRAGAWSKLRAHAARFALILARLRVACDPFEPDDPEGTAGTLGPVNAHDVHGAIQLVDYFKSHLAEVDRQVTAGLGSGDARAIVEWIGRHGLDSFRQRDVKHHLRRFRDHPARLGAALDCLQGLGAIRPLRPQSDPSRPGRKPSPAYEVHPDLRPKTP